MSGSCYGCRHLGSLSKSGGSPTEIAEVPQQHANSRSLLAMLAEVAGTGTTSAPGETALRTMSLPSIQAWLRQSTGAALCIPCTSCALRVMTQTATFRASLSVLQPVLMKRSTLQVLQSIAKNNSENPELILSHICCIVADFWSQSCLPNRLPDLSM